ncbi:porin family protein [Shewanella sp. 30m-9]
MINNKLFGMLLLCITFNDAWATNLTNPTTSKGQKCVSVKTLDTKEIESGSYNVDIEIIGHCIEKMNVEVCPSKTKKGCEFHVLPPGDRIKSQLHTQDEIPDVYYKWGFYETSSNPASQASAPNWNYIEVAYLSADIDVLDQSVKPNGYGVIGSTLVGDSVILSLAYNRVSEDDVLGSNIDATLSQASATIGYRYRTSDTTDLFVMASYLYGELEGSLDGESESYDDNGYGLRVGVRSMVTESFEASATIDRIEIDSQSETGFAVSAYYHFNKRFAIGAGYAIADDADMYNASLRVSF